MLENNINIIAPSSSSDPFSSSENGALAIHNKRKRKPAGTPDPDAEVVSLSPKTLLESDRYVCEICNQGFQRDQNLQMHRRRHKVPWKLLKRETQEVRKRVFVCPEPSCLHHDPCHALGDLVGIKKHFRRKHSNHKQWVCDKCNKGYAVQSDYKAHLKTCGTRGHSCDCGRVFSRVESFIEHQDACTMRRVQQPESQAMHAQPACSSRTASSTRNTSAGNRVFAADHTSTFTNLSSPQNISINASLNSISSGNYSRLYHTARIFTGPSNYSFSIKKQGRHFIRLHFFPFVHETYNMSTAKFSVSSQSFTLIKDYQSQEGSSVKEYSLNIASDRLVLSFTPFANSFAFINALEVISLPDELIPQSAKTIDPQGSSTGNQSLQRQALETVARVNMGGKDVPPQNDVLWRRWVSDDAYLKHSNLVMFVSNTSIVNFTDSVTENIAPREVYGTATIVNSAFDPTSNVNVTWNFDVDPGFEFLVRFHFCDIYFNNISSLAFNVYINSWSAQLDFDLHKLPSYAAGNPYYMDFITRESDSPKLHVSIGRSALVDIFPNAILNGLEIMKINNSRGDFDVFESSSPKSSKTRVGLIVGVASGSCISVGLALVLVLLCRRRNRLAHGHLKANEEFAVKEGHISAIFSSSKIGYRFPFVAIQEAADNFSESLVIGIGGFGKVYKGVLRDETKVAVKRGGPQSHQGLAEFRTEIEMLSQFRHRHLVSLIGYCDERNEMIIIYEYMENGTLKDHLYASNFPSLSWRKRLEICIGAARGLHYLHTGSTKAIIHRDVKSANILLDENLMAKVADFGLSKIGPDLDQTHVSTAVKGSFGYLDPEYLTKQQLTEKSDVYSFGVVMFEILCGRPVIDPSLPREKVNLVEWAMKCQETGQLKDIVDPTLTGQIKPDSLNKFVEIAEKCLAQCGIDRPSMGDVLWNLEYALQLQGDEGKSSPKGETSSPNNHSHLQTGLSNTEFSTASVGDLAGVSMSKVFAQMVREEMREM